MHIKNHRQRLQWEEKEILSRAPNYRLSPEDMISAELSEQTKSPNKEKKGFSSLFNTLGIYWQLTAVSGAEKGSMKHFRSI